MAARYRCPSCRTNRVRFAVVFHLWQEFHKDPRTGAVTYRADEWRTVRRKAGGAEMGGIETGGAGAFDRSVGEPDVSIRCLECGHMGDEAAFVAAARKAT